MAQNAISNRCQNILSIASSVVQFVTSPFIEERKDRPGVCDFLLGDPHEMPLPGFTKALKKWGVPKNKDWFAYKLSEPESQEIIAQSLRQSHGLPFEPEDIMMTNGAFAGLAVTLSTITDPDDEIIYISPPWFFYETLIAANYGKPVRVNCNPQTFDLDLAAIRAAITPRTRGIIINSPNNPTGKIYPPETLQALAELLVKASEQNQRTVYLISDESYNRIVYDGQKFPSPTAFYSSTFLVYTYGKTLLSPGQRIGYIALPPSAPDREALRDGLFVSQIANGFAFPNALLQHALADLETLSIDVGHLQKKRDQLFHALSEMGYDLMTPEGTFYLLVRCPIEDDMAFIYLLADQNIYCLPGSVFEMPGYFRISLTANDDMIDRALPGFDRVLKSVQLSGTEAAH